MIPQPWLGTALGALEVAFWVRCPEHRGAAMSRRPIATVTVIHRPDFGLGAIRVEVVCPAGVTGVTSIPGRLPAEVRGPTLVLAACTEHEARCGRCDLDEVRQHADVQLRAALVDAWDAWRAAHDRRHLAGRLL
jgi:hypothetical protein